MKRARTICEIDARIEAIEECREHLRQEWTDDREERKQGELIALRMQHWIDKLLLQKRRLNTVNLEQAP